MTKQITVSAVASLLVAVMGIFSAQDAAAQGPLFSPPVQPVVGGHHPGHFTMPIIPMPRQQYPVYVTPNEFAGINPWTGGWNTRNGQIDNTYFDHGRNGSQYNGSKRWVSRPIYDAYGNVSGHSQGYIWNNSITGQEHGNVRDVTNNGQGGQHETIRMYSTIDPSQQGK